MNERIPHHDRTGQGGVPLILGPAIGTSLRLWDAVLPALAEGGAVIRYDLPGHGATPGDVLPDLAPGATTVADLARTILDLADHLGCERFAYAGVSLGGAIGVWLAAHCPDRVAALTVICSAARFGDPEQWRRRAALVRAQGTGPVADTAADRWFTAGYAAVGDPVIGELIGDLRAADPAAYAACCDALAGLDLRGDLALVSAPTLVIAGRADVATPVAQARELADGIPGASLLEVANAAHLALVEQPGAVAEAMRSHAASRAAWARRDPRRAAGICVRRAVLGDAHVDRALANTTAFTADFQDLITRYAWGEIWSRPGLERRMRSAVAITALVARGHQDELAVHVRGALNNGLSREDITEILLQTAVYCGVPAANAAFAVAQRVLADFAEQPGAAD
jgi:3-oxoadipate enol-lactonase/4-carboxymuconolactone decarboxylase